MCVFLGGFFKIPATFNVTESWITIFLFKASSFEPKYFRAIASVRNIELGSFNLSGLPIRNSISKTLTKFESTYNTPLSRYLSSPTFNNLSFAK